MKARPLTVYWHEDNQPIYTAHFQPKNGTQPAGKPADVTGPLSPRLATGGGDSTVRLWVLEQANPSDEASNGTVKVHFLSALNKHTQPVNVVRFDPTGTLLASGGDDGLVLIWALESVGMTQQFGSDQQDLETWSVVATCRGTGSEIYDLSWSPDGKYVAAGSMDSIVYIYDAGTGECMKRLNDHSHYVQGVAWDPFNEYLATESSDRSLNIYCIDPAGKEPLAVKGPQRMSRTELPDGRLGIFHNESLSSFFRRLCFSPDGSLLLAPAGKLRQPAEKVEPENPFLDSPAELPGASQAEPPQTEPQTEPPVKQEAGHAPQETGQDKPKDETNVVYVYTRGALTHGPVGIFPGGRPTLGVCFSPVLRALEGKPTSGLDLPYRMIYATAQTDRVVIYDTSRREPLGIISSIHYSSLTDLAWTPDGQTLLVTSTDGFCSVISFDNHELGDAYTGDVAKPEPADQRLFKRGAARKFKREPDTPKTKGDIKASQTPTRAQQGFFASPVKTESKQEPAPDAVKEAVKKPQSVKTEPETEAVKEAVKTIKETPTKKRRIAPTLLSKPASGPPAP